MPRPIGTAPNTIDVREVEKRLSKAVTELQEHATPGLTTPQRSVWRSNLNGTSPFAHDVWEAGNLVLGSINETRLRRDGYELETIPKGVLSTTDLETLRNLAMRVLSELRPGGTDELPRSALDNLPAHVDAYWNRTFGPNKLAPAQRDAMVALIRSAASPAETEADADLPDP